MVNVKVLSIGAVLAVTLGMVLSPAALAGAIEYVNIDSPNSEVYGYEEATVWVEAYLRDMTDKKYQAMMKYTLYEVDEFGPLRAKQRIGEPKWDGPYTLGNVVWDTYRSWTSFTFVPRKHVDRWDSTLELRVFAEKVVDGKTTESKWSNKITIAVKK